MTVAGEVTEDVKRQRPGGEINTRVGPEPGPNRIDHAIRSGVGHDSHRGPEVQGSTNATPVLRNSLAFLVTTVSSRQAAVAAGRRRGEYRVRQVIVERLAPATFLLRDSGTHLGVHQGPIDDSILKQFVEKVSEPFGKVVAAPTGSETADPVQNFPDSDGGETDPLFGNRIEKGGDAWFRPRPHHLRDDVGVKEPGQPLGHALSSSANETGL